MYLSKHTNTHTVWYLIYLCLCSKYEHFLNIYASRDSITQIYVVYKYISMLVCYALRWQQKRYQHTPPHICKHAVFMFSSQATVDSLSISFLFTSVWTEHTYVYMLYHVKWERFFYLFVVETFFYEEAFLGRKFVRSTLNFPCQMKGGNHLTLLTSKNLHSHVNLTQNLFIFLPHIFYYCAGWLDGFFLYQSTHRKKNTTPRRMDF